MNKVLGNCSLGKDNNFDILRFIAALAVIFSHSFELVPHAGPEPLMVFSDNRLSIGHLSVAIFFVISGFLITQSYERSKTLRKYFFSRFLRIYPALFVVTVFTVFIIGTALTVYPLSRYFTHIDTVKYFINITAVKIYFRLGGVFDDRPYPNFAINGSLWTLPYELLCYFLVPAVALVLQKKFKQAMLFLPVIFVFLWFQQIMPLFINSWCFLCGALLYIYRNKIILNPMVAVFALIVFILNVKFNAEFISETIIMGISLSYFILYICFLKPVYFKNFSKSGDYSYGLYIWAFPVQQILVLYYQDMNNYTHTIISALITFILAFLSWHLIEKQALKLKKMKAFS